jgi:magnesium transporter
MLNIENTIDRIRELIENGDNSQLREELETYHSADLADIFQELKPEERLRCITNVNEELASDVIEYLPPQLQVEILSEIDENLAS